MPQKVDVISGHNTRRVSGNCFPSIGLSSSSSSSCDKKLFQGKSEPESVRIGTKFWSMGLDSDAWCNISDHNYS